MTDFKCEYIVYNNRLKWNFSVCFLQWAIKNFPFLYVFNKPTFYADIGNGDVLWTEFLSWNDKCEANLSGIAFSREHMF